MINFSPDKLEEEIKLISRKMQSEKQRLQTVVELFRAASVYTVHEDRGGTIKDYQYFIYPFKGVTIASCGLYRDMAKYLARMVPADTEIILSIESDGIGLATLVAAELDLPLMIAKPFHYHVPCVVFTQETGYYSRPLYIAKAISGKKVAIIDCLVSTSETIDKMIAAVTSLPQTSISGIFCLNNKSNYHSSDLNFGVYPFRYLFDTRINNAGKVEAELSNDLKKILWQSIDREFYNLTKVMLQFSNFSKQGYQTGSIIVDADTLEILAWGYRRGHVHAEQDAISMLQNSHPDWPQKKLCLYSTMEPCTTRNGSGYIPCAELISRIPQIRWVVVGQIDHYNEKINGVGIKQLTERGKNVRLMKTQEIFYAQPIPKDACVSSACSLVCLTNTI